MPALFIFEAHTCIWIKYSVCAALWTNAKSYCICLLCLLTSFYLLLFILTSVSTSHWSSTFYLWRGSSLKICCLIFLGLVVYLEDYYKKTYKVAKQASEESSTESRLFGRHHRPNSRALTLMRSPFCFGTTNKTRIDPFHVALPSFRLLINYSSYEARLIIEHI